MLQKFNTSNQSTTPILATKSILPLSTLANAPYPSTIDIHKTLSFQVLILQAQLITLSSLRHLIKHLAFQNIHEQWSNICALSMPTKCINHQQLSSITHKTTTNQQLTWILNGWSFFKIFTFSNSSKNLPILQE